LSNADALTALRQLRSSLSSGQIGVEEAYAAFERLTYVLSDVTPQDGLLLGALVSDIELIRFTRLPHNQPAAVDEALGRAEGVFERCV